MDGNNNGHLGDLLTDLVYCDFLCSYKVREKKVKTNSSIYKLVDFCTLFYHSFIGKLKVTSRRVANEPVASDHRPIVVELR